MNHYGILAFPASHSQSPELHNSWFKERHIDAVFERYEIPPAELNTFFDQNFRKQRNIAGLAVSIPHKEAIIPLLDQIDEAAQKIGAVNTIYWKNIEGATAPSRLQGANTDCLGFSKALRETYDVFGKKVLVVGAGGAARAIVYALQQDGADQIIIANRAPEKAELLAKHFGVQWKLLADVRPEEYELVVNTTPLGMKGENENLSPLPSDFWRAHLTAFDIVYTPAETRFLREAKAGGAQAISGEKMFLYQAQEQFKIWTNQLNDQFSIINYQ